MSGEPDLQGIYEFSKRTGLLISENEFDKPTEAYKGLGCLHWLTNSFEGGLGRCRVVKFNAGRFFAPSPISSLVISGFLFLVQILGMNFYISCMRIKKFLMGLVRPIYLMHSKLIVFSHSPTKPIPLLCVLCSIKKTWQMLFSILKSNSPARGERCPRAIRERSKKDKVPFENLSSTG